VNAKDAKFSKIDQQYGLSLELVRSIGARAIWKKPGFTTEGAENAEGESMFRSCAGTSRHFESFAFDFLSPRSSECR